MAIKMHASLAVPVGEWLKTEIIEPSGVTLTALAEHFGVSRQTISAVLNGRSALSADMAMRFEEAFGVKADTLLRMQLDFDMAQVRTNPQRQAVERLVAA